MRLGHRLCKAVDMGGETLVTALQASRILPTVSRHLIYVWRAQGKLHPHGMRGRSPLYRWSDITAVERQTRTSDPAGQRARRTLVA
jgi:hypothetical protein